jgi:HAMP domain-containing protein
VLNPVTVLEGVTPWSVVVSYPPEVATAAARQLLGWVVTAALLACLLAAVAMTWLVRTLTGPLRQLSHTIHGLASGHADLRVQLPVQGQDEISEISDGFNRFAAKLRGAFGEVGEVSQRGPGLRRDRQRQPRPVGAHRGTGRPPAVQRRHPARAGRVGRSERLRRRGRHLARKRWSAPAAASRSCRTPARPWTRSTTPAAASPRSPA